MSCALPVRRVPSLFVAISLLVACLGCGVSPAGPTASDRDPRLTLSPMQPVVGNGFVQYTAFFSVINPETGSEITIRLAEMTVIGSDGSVYGTVTETAPDRIGAGVSVGGARYTFIDRNASRPVATRYRLRFTYTRADGSSGTLEGTAAIVR